MALLALPLLAAPQTVQSQHVLVAFQVLVTPQSEKRHLAAPALPPLSLGGDPLPFSCTAILWRSSAAPVVSHRMVFFPYHFDKNPFNF